MQQIRLRFRLGAPGDEDFRFAKRNLVSAANGSGQRNGSQAGYEAAQIAFSHRLGAADGNKRVRSVLQTNRGGQRAARVGQLAYTKAHAAAAARAGNLQLALCVSTPGEAQPLGQQVQTSSLFSARRTAYPAGAKRRVRPPPARTAGSERRIISAGESRRNRFFRSVLPPCVTSTV